MPFCPLTPPTMIGAIIVHWIIETPCLSIFAGNDLSPPVYETKMLPQHQKETGSRDNFYISPIHALVIYQIPWIRRLSDPFKQNSDVLLPSLYTNTKSRVNTGARCEQTFEVSTNEGNKTALIPGCRPHGEEAPCVIADVFAEGHGHRD